MTIRSHGLQFFAIEEIRGGASLSEEEPVPAGSTGGAAMMEECSKGSNTGAGADHYDRCGS
jgi:hypothetical protein